MSSDDATPINNQLIEWRLSELRVGQEKILDKMDEFLTTFNNHTREDAILAERVKAFEENRKGAVGFWSGISGAVTGAGAVIYSLFKGHGLILLCLLACSCGNTKTVGTDGYQVKEVTKETPTQDGGRIIEKTITHSGQSESTTKTEADDTTRSIIGSVTPILGSAFGIATGTPGLPWGELLGGVATVAATGWAALKHGQSSEKQKQIDFHKNDADEAYKKLETQG